MHERSVNAKDRERIAQVLATRLELASTARHLRRLRRRALKAGDTRCANACLRLLCMVASIHRDPIAQLRAARIACRTLPGAQSTLSLAMAFEDLGRFRDARDALDRAGEQARREGATDLAEAAASGLARLTTRLDAVT